MRGAVAAGLGVALAGVLCAAPGVSQQAAPTGPENRDAGTAAVDLGTISRRIVELTNAERKRAGLAPFSRAESLDRCAAGHSRDMAGRGYFSHTSAGGGLAGGAQFSDRIRGSGLPCGTVAENIAIVPVARERGADGGLSEQLAVRAVRMWMQSPGHRKNIMNPALDAIGVGGALGINHSAPGVYLTQDFAQRRQAVPAPTPDARTVTQRATGARAGATGVQATATPAPKTAKASKGAKAAKTAGQ